MKPIVKSSLKLGGFGLVLYLVFLVILFPASLGWKLAPDSIKRQVQITGIQGRIWNGSAQGLIVNRNDLGKLSWTLSPWTLLTGSAAGSFIIDREPEELTGDYRVSGPGKFTLSNVDLRMLGESLEQLTRPFILHGSITASFDSIRYSSGETLHLDGTVNLNYTQVEGLQDIQLGDIEAMVQPEGNGSIASFTNKASPLNIQGKVEMNPNGQMNLTLGLMNQDRTRKDLDNILAVIGKPDVSGRVTLNYRQRIQLP